MLLSLSDQPGVDLLLNLLQTRQKFFASLASAWIANGAEAFSLWSNGRSLAVWPENSAEQTSVQWAAILVNGRVIGELQVIGLAGKDTEARLTADAMAIGHMLQFEDELTSMTEELIGSQDQLLALYELTDSMKSRLNIQEVLQCLVVQAYRLVKCETASAVFVQNEQNTIIHHPFGLLSDWDILNFFEITRQTGRHSILSREDMPELVDALDNIVVQPILVHETVHAILLLCNTVEPCGSPELKLLGAVCDQVGAQIENVLLHQETLIQERLQTEMQLAQEVQVRLLPTRPPLVNGLELFAGSLPASQVGGDFYDFISQPDKNFMFALGDVSGKGLSAALLMAMTRTMIRSKSYDVEDALPMHIMALVNEQMYDDFTQVDKFCTLFLGEYDHAARQIRFANAGHSPVIYCPAGGKARLLEADGTAVGVLSQCLCDEQSIPFNTGDVLVVATDGFPEARGNKEELFGYERLLTLIQSVADQSVDDITSALFSAVASFSAGHPQDDDQTLIVIKGV